MTKKTETSTPAHGHLQRKLKNRHIQLISIGGAIGTGLFMSSGKTIHAAGPSILLVYAVIGFFLFFVMRAMGELLLSNLNYKSFSDFATDILGPWAGFFTGWTYWLCWVVTGIADVIAICYYVDILLEPFGIQFSPIVISLVTIAIIFGLNALTVKLFGETEFWFAMIKIITIVIFIITGFSMAMMHYETPFGNASFTHLWNNGDLFPNGIFGFLAGFQMAIFAFVGIELVGTTAAETENPKHSLPKAINAIPLRILAFYVLSLAAIICVTPWNNVSPNDSPFIHTFQIMGLGLAAMIINFVVLTSAASSANSGIFSTSRMLYGLGLDKNAPKIFSKLSPQSVPLSGLIFSCICLIAGSLILQFNKSVMESFEIVTTMSVILFIFVWSIILISYIVYRKKYPSRNKESIYKVPMGTLICYLCLIFFAFILVLFTQFENTAIALYHAPIWFIILGISWYFCLKAMKRNA